MSGTCAMFSPDCAGRLEWHHAIKQQRLRREFRYGAYRVTAADEWTPVPRDGSVPQLTTEIISLGVIRADSRNRVWLCSHHHELVTNGRLEVALPQSVYEFADEYGLRAQLENDIARRSAA